MARAKPEIIELGLGRSGIDQRDGGQVALEVRDLGIVAVAQGEDFLLTLDHHSLHQPSPGPS